MFDSSFIRLKGLARPIKRKVRRISSGFLLGCALMVFGASASAAWNLWDQYKAVHFDNGRIVDFRDSGPVTTSESQSYGLFFALVADDKEAFDRILDWTVRNLADGDMKRNLPAWLWGRRQKEVASEKEGENSATKNGEVSASGQENAAVPPLQPQKFAVGIIDANNATDADLWMVYSLLEASRIWKEPKYKELASAMLSQLESLIVDIPNIGKVLLPGRQGFVKEEGYLLNPSYYPPFILQRIAAEYPQWEEVRDGLLKVLVKNAPDGFASDWAYFDREGNWLPKGNSTGSWDAIRVYLWVGMLSKDNGQRELLKNQFKNMVLITEKMNFPPEEIDTDKLVVVKPQREGFGAALLPLLDNPKTKGLIRTSLEHRTMKPSNYYQNSLKLFGLGFDNAVFKFSPEGYLVLSPEDPRMRGIF